jgi:long-chain acyl-CoA synthetase
LPLAADPRQAGRLPQPRCLPSRAGELELRISALGTLRADRLGLGCRIADLAAVHLGAIPCTTYRTSSPEQVEYVARHSGATLVVLEDAVALAHWRTALEALPAVRTVIHG